jgi:hypothetical protein
MMARLAPRLLWAGPAVFVMGVTALALSRVLFYIFHPSGFVGTLPSISETISVTPGSTAFQSLMCAIAPCIVIFWLTNFSQVRVQIGSLAASGRSTALATGLNIAACATGLLAGGMLAGLTAIKLHDGHIAHHWHILLSEGFYSSQVISFLFDAACAMARRDGSGNPAQARSLRLRLVIGPTATVTALMFLYLYVWREIVPDPLLSQAIYVACEYTLATLCFAYPVAAYPELRAFYGGEVQSRALSAASDNQSL